MRESGDRREQAPGRARLAFSVAGIAICLLIIGAISSTLVRHLVQILPALIVLAGIARDARWARDAVLPVSVAWLAIMLFIWLTITGVASIAPGTYTPPERALSLCIALLGVLGAADSLRAGSGAGTARRLAAWAGFGALQVLAIWASLRPALAQD